MRSAQGKTRTVARRVFTNYLQASANNISRFYTDFRSMTSSAKENIMRRITTVLDESDAMAVRRAGVERVVLTPLPLRMCGVDALDIESEKRVAELRKRVRLDVAADENISGSVVAAIRKIAQAGKIVLASSHEKLARLAA
jgi:L-lactate utilization protein LutC